MLITKARDAQPGSLDERLRLQRRPLAVHWQDESKVQGQLRRRQGHGRHACELAVHASHYQLVRCSLGALEEANDQGPRLCIVVMSRLSASQDLVVQYKEPSVPATQGRRVIEAQRQERVTQVDARRAVEVAADMHDTSASTRVIHCEDNVDGS